MQCCNSRTNSRFVILIIMLAIVARAAIAFIVADLRDGRPSPFIY